MIYVHVLMERVMNKEVNLTCYFKYRIKYYCLSFSVFIYLEANIELLLNNFEVIFRNCWITRIKMLLKRQRLIKPISL